MTATSITKKIMCSCGLALLTGCIAINRSVEFVSVTPNSNLSLLKNEIRNFYKTGAYQADLSRVAEAAENFVALRNSFFNKPAVVFDLDDVLLSSYR
jgi:hypothetical protein